MKKILAILLAAVMLFGLTACGGTGDVTLGMSDSPLAAPTITPDYEVPEDFKVGFICLHDEKSSMLLTPLKRLLSSRTSRFSPKSTFLRPTIATKQQKTL